MMFTNGFEKLKSATVLKSLKLVEKGLNGKSI